MVTNLDEDVQGEILLRLPVRSLVRFRCVCKSWCALTKSPRFVHLHMIRRRASGNQSILVNRKNHFKALCYFRDFESLSDSDAAPEYEVSCHKSYRLAGHSNGIVSITDGDFNGFLFNPSLRDVRLLPIIPTSRPRKFCELTCGFGFDEATKDYKVVRLVINILPYYNPSPLLEVEIYSLRTDRWRKFGTIPAQPHVYIDGSPIFFKGLIHWPTSYSPQGCIVTFNTTTEVFESMSYPRGWQDYYSYLVRIRPKIAVMVIDDSIALVVYTFRTRWLEWLMDVWLMKEYGVSESWTRLYSVPRPPFPFVDCIQPLFFKKKDKLIMGTSHGRFVCYDSATNQHYLIRQLVDPGRSSYTSLQFFQVVACHESLVSIHKV